ncbi:MAG: glycosyltransferase [Bacteroides sp.]|nr:glycosyltransferase [Bacteroides sp.]
MTAMDYTLICQVLTGACGLFCLIQLMYLFFVYAKMYRASRMQAQTETVPDNCPPLSVIIVTKDSGQLLKENLPSILTQDYPTYEVIVVNDQSAGEDEEILKLLENDYPNLYHTFIPQTARYVSRKKLGIAMGIKASRYDWIVVTEPTCKPVSDQWLKHLAVHFQEGTDIVLGYCGYTGGKGLFGKRVKADNLFQAMRYLGAALNRHPYMGIGQNLAYRKNVYNGHKGFADQLTLQRGDDDLFINALADSGNTAVALHPDSFMEQKVPPFKRIWFEDKVNRLVTGKFYHGAARFMNGLETWTCALFHLCTLIGLIMSIRYYEWMYTGIIAILWLLRFVLTMNNFRKTAKATGEKSCCFFLLFDWCRPLWALQIKIHYWCRTKADFLRK